MCCSYINITSITVVTSPRQQNESTTSNKTFPIYLLTCGFDYVHLVYCFLHARQREFTFDFNLLLILVQSLCIQYLHFNKKIGLRIDNKMTQVTWVFSTILIENSLRTATKYFVFFSYVMPCTIWYHLYNLKHVKNTHGGVLLSVKLQAEIMLREKLYFSEKDGYLPYPLP